MENCPETQEEDPGFPISTVRIGSWDADRMPMATTTSAVCKYCDQYATQLATSGGSLTDGDAYPRARVRKSTITIIYVCDDHYQDAVDELIDTYGWASNTYEADELATKVYASAENARMGDACIE